MKKRIVLCFCCLATFSVLADSPLTSIFFATAYSDVPVIADLLQKRSKEDVFQFELSSTHIKFLDDKTISLDQKIALINALGWGPSSNINNFKNHLSKKYTLEPMVIDSILSEPLYEDQEFYKPAQVISDDDLTLLAYVQVMHDYFHPMLGMQCAYRAALRNQQSEATTYILAFILAQYYLDMDWCSIYPVFVSARDAGEYSRDFLRKEAVASIFEYINLYEHICDEEQNTAENISEEDVTAREIFTELYWQKNPAYTKPSHQQISDKKNKVDLLLLNKQSDKSPMYMDWVLFDETSNGTMLLLKIKNEGNVASVETNLRMKIDNTFEYEGTPMLYFQKNIPAIPANETVELKIVIPDYWIYDSNADFEIHLDYDNNIIESNEKNNVYSFHENG